MELREYQKESIQAIRGEYKAGFKRPVLCLPTGAGKTVIASKIIERALERGASRVVFMIDSLTLVEQTIKAFAQCGMDVGVIQGIHDKTDIHKPVQIATPQTIKRRFSGRNADMFKNYRVDLLIVDECHVQHSGIKEAAEHWGCPVLGLTATPYTKGMGNFFDSVVQPVTMRWLIDEGYLADYKAYSHYVPDMKGIKSSKGDYVAKSAAERYEDTHVIGDVIATWRKHAEGKKTLAFASTVASAKAFSEMFMKAGISSDFTSGYLDTDDAIERLDNFVNGNTTVLWNVQKLTKGFDMPTVECIIDCAPTRSKSLHIQKLGRGLRVHADKSHLVCLDNAGNFIRNGFPEDAIADVLDMGDNDKDRAAKEKLPKPCGKCGFIKITHKCPMCGFAPVPVGDTETEAGELVELTKTQKKHNRDMTSTEKEQFFGGLKQYARDKGFSQGWASHRYKSKLGVWPNAHKNAPLCAPNATVMGHIQHGNIAYANRRQA